MKKIIIAAAVICMSAMSQAALAKWSEVNIQSSPATTVAEGWVVCLYEGNAADYSYEAALNGALTPADTSTTFKTGNFINAGNTTTGFGSFDNGSEHTFYAARASFQRNAGLFAIAREGCLSGLQRES